MTDLQPYKIINLSEVELIYEESKDKLVELIFNYKTSYLQAKIDFERLKEEKLKIIVIDKLLRLNFSNNYLVFTDNDFSLLTKDERNFLEKDFNDMSQLTFIKKQFTEEIIIYEMILQNRLTDKKYFLILKNDSDNLLIFNFIKWVLENNEK